MMPLTRTCKEATLLMVAREDRRLDWRNRLALRLHLLVCRACPRFERQMLGMRNQLKAWRGYSAPD